MTLRRILGRPKKIKPAYKVPVLSFFKNTGIISKPERKPRVTKPREKKVKEIKPRVTKPREKKVKEIKPIIEINPIIEIKNIEPITEYLSYETEST